MKKVATNILASLSQKYQEKMESLEPRKHIMLRLEKTATVIFNWQVIRAYMR